MTRLLFQEMMDWFHEELSCCPRCRKWGGSPFCERCFQLFLATLPSQLNVTQVGGKLPVHYMLPWTEFSDPWVRPIIYSLKKGRRVRTATRLAWLYALKYRKHFDLHEQSILVPVPPRGGGTFDHAFVFAKELGRVLNRELWLGLKRVDNSPTPQKRLKKPERQSLRFSPIMPPPAGVKLILVDDVVTSGATAQAVFEALGQPKDFQVMSLAYRPLQGLENTFITHLC